MFFPTLKLFKNLIGSWKINRALGNIANTDGIASFIPMNEYKLHYKEILNLKINDCPPIKSKMSYMYKYFNGKILKYYDERPLRLLYQLTFPHKDNMFATGYHLCGPDQYNANYYFYNDNSFTLSYKVIGPNKDYTITTNFEKLVNEADNIKGLSSKSLG